MTAQFQFFSSFLPKKPQNLSLKAENGVVAGELIPDALCACQALLFLSSPHVLLVQTLDCAALDNKIG